MITPQQFLARIIKRWEGGYESYVDDAGNWVTFPDGTRVDVGTNMGVTPAALAMHRGLQPYQITTSLIKALTMDEAVDIGFKHYYLEPHYDLFKWGPTTASIEDFGWGAGPGQATKSLQRDVLGFTGADVDSGVGPKTAAAYNAWLASLGEDAATKKIHDVREAFYRMLGQIHPEDQQYVQGWVNRDDWASAVNPEWHSLWS